MTFEQMKTPSNKKTQAAAYSPVLLNDTDTEHTLIDENVSKCSCCCSKDDLFDSEKRPTNELLLWVAFISFLVFTTAQTIASVIAKSQAMLGDSAAMGVDAMTYAFNLYAERGKAGNVSRRKRLLLELIPPLISVTTLILVTIYVVSSAIETLTNVRTEKITGEDIQQDPGSQPNANIMMLFSFLNLLLDILNVTCFARARKALGFDYVDVQQTSIDALTDHHIHEKHLENEMSCIKGSSSEDDEDDDITEPTKNCCAEKECDCSIGSDDDSSIDDGKSDRSLHHSKSAGVIAGKDVDELAHNVLDFSGTCPDHPPIGDKKTNYPEECEKYVGSSEDAANLNMCSAYTHVFADTLRSIAVLVAAGIAKFSPIITPEEADAYAAVIVSFVIVLSLAPLFRGLVYTWTELQGLEENVMGDDHYTFTDRYNLVGNGATAETLTTREKEIQSYDVHLDLEEIV